MLREIAPGKGDSPRFQYSRRGSRSFDCLETRAEIISQRTSLSIERSSPVECASRAAGALGRGSFEGLSASVIYLFLFKISVFTGSRSSARKICV
jgi:hypothetical protein